MFTFDTDLKARGWKKYSQNDEDGILDYLFHMIPHRSFYVEIGISPPQSAREDNCRLLYENGWNGLRVDATPYPGYGVLCERVTPLNINPILKKYGVPEGFDLLSLDIDGQDFWVWMAMMYRPSVAVIEYNGNIPLEESKTVPFDADFAWDGTRWFGASLRALHSLGKSKGYVMVYANGVNAFFVREGLVSNGDEFILQKLYCHKKHHAPDVRQRPWVAIPA